MDATSFDGFEEAVQTFEALEKCLSIKIEWEDFVAAVGEEPFWQLDIKQIQTTAQVIQTLNGKR